MKTVALRCFSAFGPRKCAGDYSGVINIFPEQVQAGEPITVHRDGSQTRVFGHVRDVVAANLRTATTDHIAGAHNIGRGEQTNIRTLTDQDRGIAESGLKILHTDPRPDDVDANVADISKSPTRTRN